jgi:hypothetical protein
VKDEGVRVADRGVEISHGVCDPACEGQPPSAEAVL